MPDSKRQCSKCQFFQIAQLSGNGWCTHPKRQVASDVKILVREKELACRNSWGDDLWIDAVASPSSTDVVASPRKGLFYVNNRVDDEVTSVVDTTSKEPPSPAGRPASEASEDIVTVTSVRRGDAIVHRAMALSGEDDLNSPAIADQAERARHMARGSKDAIQKARERHTQRRKPTREPIEPQPDEAASDHILAAQDRDQYNRSEVGNDRAPVDDYRNTPPVPRQEVEANGASLSPANRTDDRFDSIAQLKPEIDLTQLRGFLKRSGPSRREATTGDAGASVTSYDLVLKRAQEIKAAVDIERDYHLNLNAQNERKTLVSVPEPASATVVHDQPAAQALPVSNSQPGVIWDVDGARLNIAFERARKAIDQPVHVSGVPLEPMYRIDYPAPPPESHRAAHRPPVLQDPGLEFAGDDPGQFAGSDDWADADDLLAVATDHGERELSYEPGYDLHERTSSGLASPSESPRGSWWRSLNFGLRRRSRSEPAPAPAYIDDEEWTAEGMYAAAGDDDGFHGGVHAKDQIDSGAGYEELPPERFDEADDVDVFFATSDESWLQDAWEFPEPQPEEWHERRAHLLERSPEPVATTEGAGEAANSHSHRSVSTIADDRPATFHGEPLAGIAAGRPEASSFAFDDPSGMDAFRSALFGERHHTASPNGVPLEMSTAFSPVDRVQEQGSRLVQPVSYAQDCLPDRPPGGSTGMPGRPPTRRSSRNSRHFQPHNAFDTDFDIRDAIVDQDAGIEGHFDVASHVPRSCSTCRSFQASDNGERGWCMNDYAATHRQMVNSDDLACRSSIGDWWLAADTSWIPPTDVIQPETPRTDRLVARSSPRGAPASRTIRHERTSKVG